MILSIEKIIWPTKVSLFSHFALDFCETIACYMAMRMMNEKMKIYSICIEKFELTEIFFDISWLRNVLGFYCSMHSDIHRFFKKKIPKHFFAFFQPLSKESFFTAVFLFVFLLQYFKPLVYVLLLLLLVCLMGAFSLIHCENV